ncbi:MAG: sortase [Bacilli bacterium]|nr:sortase [Bacilli bacterium]
MQKVINVIYIIIIVIELFLFKMYNDKKNEEKKEQIESSSINYILNQGIEYRKKSDEKNVINYEMILEIPKINLKKGILSKADKDNNIDKNITILEQSSYPDKVGNIFLAAHSGSGNKSYFNNLVQLKKEDEAKLYFNEKIYTYKLQEIRSIEKNKYITISTKTNNNLILITCNQKEKNRFLFFIFTLKAED